MKRIKATSARLKRGTTRSIPLLGIIVLTAWPGPLDAQTIPIPNGSFESPTTVFADPRIDSWQKTPKPDWYDESGGFTWDQLTGVFLNTPPGTTNHIDNTEGNQAIFLFAVPQVGLFQDYNSTDWTNTTPTHAFNAKYEVGKAYQLSAGIIGGGGGMTNGVSLELSLYYRDGASNMVTVAATNITHSPTLFSNLNHFIDYQVQVPTVKATDPWAGQNIGIQLLSTVAPNLAGGYWDVDNLQLSTVISGPALLNAVRTNGQFQFILQSEPGLTFDILATTNLALPLTNWISLGILTNVTGANTFVDTTTNVNSRFYQAQQRPQ